MAHPLRPHHHSQAVATVPCGSRAVIQRMKRSNDLSKLIITVFSSDIDVENHAFGFNEDVDHGLYLELDYLNSAGMVMGTRAKICRAAIKKYKESYKTTKIPKRSLFGYNNPAHNSKVGLSILEDGAHTPYDDSRWDDKEDWLLDPERNFITYSPTSRKMDDVFTQGHSNVVFGHDKGASEHFNEIGHKQTPQQNRQWNNQKTTYHGLENYKKSAKTGAHSDRYMTPSKKAGSHSMYWDKNHDNYREQYQE
ncbi:hypothetical protein [Azospirillum soli]|uniref:hypothetical protein n=1 Tax=Azospirillum soli TaxID=1304799 RepID=UPI001AE25460|nr:hypothetical protein [Azospirillum soli]MBP2310791.1 hypothetical protein [Azospirillum soli]